jgi:hypothetical protein
MHIMFTCLHAKQYWERLGVQPIMKEAVNLDKVEAVALEHIICKKGI